MTEAAQEKELTNEEMTEFVKKHMHKGTKIITRIVELTRELLKEANEIGVEQEDVMVDLLAAITDRNIKTFGELNPLLLAFAVLELASTSNDCSILEDGSIVIAALNIEEESVRPDPDIMHRWSELYGTLSSIGRNNKTPIRQVRVGNMLMLVTDPPKQQDSTDIKVITGRGKDQLMNLIDSGTLPKNVSDTLREFFSKIPNTRFKSSDDANGAIDEALKVFSENPDFREEPGIAGIPGVKVYSYGFGDKELNEDNEDE